MSESSTFRNRERRCSPMRPGGSLDDGFTFRKPYVARACDAPPDRDRTRALGAVSCRRDVALAAGRPTYVIGACGECRGPQLALGANRAARNGTIRAFRPGGIGASAALPNAARR